MSHCEETCFNIARKMYLIDNNHFLNKLTIHSHGKFKTSENMTESSVYIWYFPWYSPICTRAYPVAANTVLF